MELTNWCVDNNKNKHSLIKKLEVWSLSITFINILIYKIYALKVVTPCIFWVKWQMGMVETKSKHMFKISPFLH